MVEPISRFMIRLLVGYRVADFRRAGSAELAYRGRFVHFGDRECAHGVDHAADDSAGGGIFHVAHLAGDGQGVAHLDAVLAADIDDDGAIGRNIGHEPVNLNHLDGRGGQRRRLLIQAVCDVRGRLVDGRAQNGVGEVGALHIERATAPAAGTSAGAQNAGAAARFLAVALDAGENFGGGGVDHARRHRAHGGGFGSLHAAESEAVERAGRRPAAHGGALVVTSELGDAADDDGIDTQNAGDLGGRVGVGAVAVGEILLGQNLVELLAFDHGVYAIVHQLIHQDVGNALADILIGAEHRGNAALHRGVIEVHHRDALFLLCRRRGNQRQEKYEGGNPGGGPHEPTIGQSQARVNDLSATPRKILRGTVVNGVSHLGENFDREGLFHADYGGARTGRAAAMEHARGGEPGGNADPRNATIRGTGRSRGMEQARRGKAGENADQRSSTGGGHVLSGGVVTHIQSAAGDDLGEAGEASVPEGGSGAATGDGAFHAGSLFAPRAFIDEEGGSSGEEAEQSLFERVRDALGGVFAYSQADRDVG